MKKATSIVEQLKNSTNAKKKKEALNEYNYAKAHANWWKGSEKWGAKELIKNGIISLDENGSAVPTSRFTNAFAYSNSTDNMPMHIIWSGNQKSQGNTMKRQKRKIRKIKKSKISKFSKSEKSKISKFSHGGLDPTLWKPEKRKS